MQSTTRGSISRRTTKAKGPIEKGHRQMRLYDPAAQKAPPERTAPKRRKHNKTIRRPAAAAFPATRMPLQKVAAARHRNSALFSRIRHAHVSLSYPPILSLCPEWCRIEPVPSTNDSAGKSK